MKWFVWMVGRLPQTWVGKLSSLRFKHPVLGRMLSFATGRFQNQDGEIQKGLGKGLKFNTGPSAAGYLLGTSEPEMQQALGLFAKPGMTVFDVGANVGFFSILACRQVGQSGKVFAFEPLEANARWIRHNLDLNAFQNCRVRVEALGGEDGQSEFIVTRTATLGRLSSGGAVDEEVDRIQVPVRKLDSLFQQGLVDIPALIKVDIEGAEVEWLKGARQLIAQAEPVLLIELHGTNEGVAAELEKLGYVARAFDQPLEKPIVECRWNSHLLAVPAAQRARLNLLGD